MREILFRGRVRGSRDPLWVQGSYDVGKKQIITGAGDPVDVEPESVGQYSGVKDKKGTRIFELDILSANLDDVFPEIETRKLVVFKHGQFCVMSDNWMTYDFSEDSESKSTVIGNVYDNPELMEVQK